MLINAITWNLSNISLAAFFIFAFILFLCMGLEWGKSIDDYFDTPKLNLPDEINLEILKENQLTGEEKTGVLPNEESSKILEK